MKLATKSTFTLDGLEQSFEGWFIDEPGNTWNGFSCVGNEQYVLHLQAWMAYVVDSDRMKQRIISSLNWEVWNYLVLALCGYADLFKDEIESYPGHKRYQWTSETWNDDVLNESDHIKLDKEIVEYVYNRENNKP